MFIKSYKGEKMVKRLREIMEESLELQGVIFIEDSNGETPCLKPAIRKADLRELSKTSKIAIADFVKDFLESYPIGKQSICTLQSLYDILEPIGFDTLIEDILYPKEVA